MAYAEIGQLPAPAAANILGAEDSSFEGGTVGHWIAAAATAISNTTDAAKLGSRSMAMTRTATGVNMSANLIPVPGFVPVAGVPYQLTVWFRPAATAARTVYCYLRWLNATGGQIRQVAGNVITVANGWVVATCADPAPAGTASLGIIVLSVDAGIGVGEIIYVDDIRLVVLDTTVPPEPKPPAVCVRRAWLTLGAARVDLEDPGGQWACTELDLGFPEVRDVTANRADRDGITDRTAYMGARAVSAKVVTTPATTQPDTLAGRFAPYMVPAARPVLHYVLDRPDLPERILTLRAAGLTWPVSGQRSREIGLQWVAADPIARDPLTRTATAWSGSSTIAGRAYPLIFNRIYPTGGGAPVTAFITPAGDVALRPLLRIYGPITFPRLFWSTVTGDPYIQYAMYFAYSYVIGAGQWVDVDTDAKTIYRQSDPSQPDPSALDWTTSQWPVLNPGRQWLMTLQGTSTTGITQAQVIWHEGYLT